MKKYLAFSLLALSLACPLFGGKPNFSKREMVEFVDHIRTSYENHYAPREWKEEFFGWDSVRIAEEIKAEIYAEKSLSIKDYHRKLRRFINSTRDYHCNIEFYSTECATLPFGIKQFEGKYYISGFDEGRIDRAIYQMERGDEILEYDGKSIGEEVARLKEGFTPNQDNETDQSLAESYFTARSGSLGMKVPRGPILIKCRSHKTGEEYSVQLCWDYSKESIEDHLVSAGLETSQEDFSVPIADSLRLKAERYQMIDPNQRGMKKSFLPKLGKTIWEFSGKSGIDAYIFLDGEKRQIGFLRIPHYKFSEEEIEELKGILKVFSEMTCGLVIDQLNNPGGGLEECYAIASMLAKDLLATPRHRFILNQKIVMESIRWMSQHDSIESEEDVRRMYPTGEILGLPITYQSILCWREYHRFILDQWKEGKVFTDFSHLMGWDYIHPHPDVHYTKPIVFLINGLDFSGGDFMPAILQDNKRVVTVGTKTAGAGGYVLGQEVLNKYGVVGYKMTGSFAIRQNGFPIENLGVTPDVPYELTLDDLRNDYQGFREVILQTLDGLLPANGSDPSGTRAEPPPPSTQSADTI